MSHGTNDPTNWRRRLAGEAFPIHDGEPDFGFFRVRSRDKSTWRTVAYWYRDDGALRCHLDGAELDPQRACELWTWACKHPITEELYFAVREGAPWPDLSEAVTRSNNAPPDNSFEALKDRIEDLAREADKIAEVATQDAADQAADLANKLGELQTAADAQRAAEKRVHDEASRAVQTKWKPIVDAADAAKRSLKNVIARFLAAKEAAAQKQREEAAKSGEPSPPPVARGSTSKAGTRGRAVSLRTIKTAKISDYGKCLAYFAQNSQVKDLVQSLANAAVRQGTTPDGCDVHEDKAAA